MGSGCGDGIVELFLRPPGKLPVPVALNAPSPTLFTNYYTRFDRKCKVLIYRYAWIKSGAPPQKMMSYLSSRLPRVFPSFPICLPRTMALPFTREDGQCNARS